MLLISLFVLFIMLLVSIISLAVRMAWGVTKFVFGLGLFCVCPLLFILVVLLGGFSSMWLPIVILGVLFGGGFRKAL